MEKEKNKETKNPDLNTHNPFNQLKAETLPSSSNKININSNQQQKSNQKPIVKKKTHTCQKKSIQPPEKTSKTKKNKKKNKKATNTKEELQENQVCEVCRIKAIAKYYEEDDYNSSDYQEYEEDQYDREGYESFIGFDYPEFADLAECIIADLISKYYDEMKIDKWLRNSQEQPAGAFMKLVKNLADKFEHFDREVQNKIDEQFGHHIGSHISEKVENAPKSFKQYMIGRFPLLKLRTFQKISI